MVAEALPATAAPGAGDGIELRPALDEEWLRVFQAIERKWPPEQDPGRALGARHRATAPRRFALARVDGEPAATGYGAARGRLALHRVASATFPEHRRLGLARAVSERLFAWGADGGARRAILQAETKNAAAQALYAQLGFAPALHLPRLRARRRAAD